MAMWRELRSVGQAYAATCAGSVNVFAVASIPVQQLKGMHHYSNMIICQWHGFHQSRKQTGPTDFFASHGLSLYLTCLVKTYTDTVCVTLCWISMTMTTEHTLTG